LSSIGGLRYFLNRSYRFARARYHASILKSDEAPPPLTLHVEPTNHCNLKCRMCFQTTMARKKGRMPFELYKRIIDQAAGWTRHLQLANFGEPLLHPQLPKMIAYGAQHGFFVEVFTNGALLDKEIAREIVGAQAGKVNVSIDALDPEVYREIRGIELEKALEGLRNLREARRRAGSKTPLIVLAGSDLKSNPGQPARIRRRYAHYGADACYVTPSMNWAGNAKDPDQVKPSGRNYRGCLFPWYLMNVSHEGIVTPCYIDAELRNEAGRIEPGRGDVKQIWNSAAMRRLRRAILDQDLKTLAAISNCHACSRLYYSQNAYSANRIRVELAQLRYFGTW